MLPERLRRMAPHMIAGQWLTSYTEVDGIRAALGRASRRLNGRVSLEETAAELVSSYSGFEADFRRFFPELIAFVLERR
jgi:acyl carrier protein phosphodiesterase